MALIDRVKGILLTPKQQWPVIEAEAATAADIFTKYAAPLALLPAIASFIGTSVFGVQIPFIGGKLNIPLGMRITQLIMSVVLSLLSVLVLALIIDALAPTFRSQKNFVQALKLSAYSSTAYWVAGLLGILPSLAFLIFLLGLYSFYLLYLGIPILMKTAQDQALPYTIAAVVAAIVVYFILAAIIGIATPKPGLSDLQLPRG